MQHLFKEESKPQTQLDQKTTNQQNTTTAGFDYQLDRCFLLKHEAQSSKDCASFSDVAFVTLLKDTAGRKQVYSQGQL